MRIHSHVANKKLHLPWDFDKVASWYENKKRGYDIPGLKATSIAYDKWSDVYRVHLYGTDIVTWYRDGRILLATGGWSTFMTYDRINGFAGVSIGSGTHGSSTHLSVPAFFNSTLELLSSGESEEYMRVEVCFQDDELMLLPSKSPDVGWIYSKMVPKTWVKSRWGVPGVFEKRMFGPTGWFSEERSKFEVGSALTRPGVFIFRDMASFEPIFAWYDGGWAWRELGQVAGKSVLNPWQEVQQPNSSRAMKALISKSKELGWSMSGPTLGECVDALRNSSGSDLGFRWHVEPEWVKQMKPALLRRKVCRFHMSIPGKHTYTFLKLGRFRHKSFQMEMPGSMLWPGPEKGVGMWLELIPTRSEALAGETLAVGWDKDTKLCLSRVDIASSQNIAMNSETALDKFYVESL